MAKKKKSHARSKPGKPKQAARSTPAKNKILKARARPKGRKVKAVKKVTKAPAPLKKISKDKGPVARTTPRVKENPHSKRAKASIGKRPVIVAKNKSKTKAAAPVIKQEKPAPPKGPIKAVMSGVAPSSGPSRTLKRAEKERFQVEYTVRSTPSVLYELISTPSGFAKWFCDDVNVRGEEYTFIWGSESETAQVLGRKQGEVIRFRWIEDEDEGAFFELRIRIDALTNEVALIVVDHAWPHEVVKSRQLWESQMGGLLRVLGS